MAFWPSIFWASLAALAYIYVGYPVACALLARLLRRWPRVQERAPWPRLSVLIAAYQEAAHIGQTVVNKLAQDYPPGLLEVIVVSDACTDGTDGIVDALADPRVRLIRQEPRAGKTAALNLAVPAARGEILVFSDANSLYAPDALRRLAACFADPAVGYATGRMVYGTPGGSLNEAGCSAYMRYENALRRWETGLGSVVGVDGGIDAVRRELYRPMRPDQLPDFVLPLDVRQQGYRVVYAPDALLHEDALADPADEWRMRVRVSLRAWHALKDKAALLDPTRFGLFAWQLFSHKLLRYLGGLFQVGAVIANLPLAAGSAFWKVVLGLQAVFYLLALAGHLGRGRQMPRVAGLAYYLCLVNAASLVAWIRFLQGRRQVIWQPRT